MFSHVTLGSSDMDASIAFYNALLIPLGLVYREVAQQRPVEIACWIEPASSLPRFFVCLPLDEKPATSGNGAMIAFTASSAAEVNSAYAAALAAGGSDEGPPGPRPQYGDGYYGAYLRDPDGNKLHVVYRGDSGDQ